MKEYIAKEYKYTQSKCKKFPATTYYTVFFITAGKCTCRSREKTYFCATEEIILVNPGTSVEIEYPASKTPLHFLQICLMNKRIWSPAFMWCHIRLWSFRQNQKSVC